MAMRLVTLSGLAIFTVGLLLSSNPCSCTDDDELTDIEIMVLYVPANCPSKTKENDMLYLHFAGFFKDGTQFDSSYDRQNPLYAPLGKGRLIPGVEKGLLDMCAGEKRRIVIPPHLGYGEEDATTPRGAKIPGNSVLTFEIELLMFNSPSQVEQSFKAADTDNDGGLSQEEIKGVIGNMENIPTQFIPKTYLDYDVNQMLEELYKLIDMDDDGKITYQEFATLAMLQPKEDNKDGRKEEL